MTTVDENPTLAIDLSREDVYYAWLGTSASNIFLMQLGFLCYETGYVQAIWTQSIIFKNLEDTFVGILTYLFFSYGLSASPNSYYGIISIPDNILFLNVDPFKHSAVFVGAAVATTSATIISGAVLERMKNKAYIAWCFLIILVNYSFVSHWVWHTQGWLFKLGFVDAAGSIVVHFLGGCAGITATYFLGPQRNMLAKDGSLKAAKPAQRPTIIAIGVLILWYGWFAFNMASPLAADWNIAADNGTAGLNTLVAPSAAALSALIILKFYFPVMSFEHFGSCIVTGLVAITSPCYTVDVWAACVIGFFSSFVYFLGDAFVRKTLKIDDPLNIAAIHVFPGLFGCITEGIFANNVMGNTGLIYGNFEHFGVQVLGCAAIVLFNVVVNLFLWKVIMEKCLFRNTTIRVSILDTYLGTNMFDLDPWLALEEIIACQSNLSKQMLLNFHQYCENRLCAEQLDFLVAIFVLRKISDQLHDDRTLVIKANLEIIDTYIMPNAEKAVNVSDYSRSSILRVRKKIMQMQSLANVPPLMSTANGMKIVNEEAVSNHAIKTGTPVNEENVYKSKAQSSPSTLSFDFSDPNLFDGAFTDVYQIMVPSMRKFFQAFDRKLHTKKYSHRLKVPFRIDNRWDLFWDDEAKRHSRSRPEYSQQSSEFESALPASMQFGIGIGYDNDMKPILIQSSATSSTEMGMRSLPIASHSHSVLKRPRLSTLQKQTQNQNANQSQGQSHSNHSDHADVDVKAEAGAQQPPTTVQVNEENGKTETIVSASIDQNGKHANALQVQSSPSQPSPIAIAMHSELSVDGDPSDTDNVRVIIH